MPKLSDTQSILISHAAQHGSCSVHPLPASLIEDTAPSARALKAIGQLMKRDLLEERETTTPEEAHRKDGDIDYGVFVTAAGLKAIGIEAGGAEDSGEPAPSPALVDKRPTKAAEVLALLKRDEGATLAELIAFTGWLPHTTRAALTGLRKRGHAIERGKRGDETCWQVAG